MATEEDGLRTQNSSTEEEKTDQSQQQTNPSLPHQQIGITTGRRPMLFAYQSFGRKRKYLDPHNNAPGVQTNRSSSPSTQPWSRHNKRLEGDAKTVAALTNQPTSNISDVAREHRRTDRPELTGRSTMSHVSNDNAANRIGGFLTKSKEPAIWTDAEDNALLEGINAKGTNWIAIRSWAGDRLASKSKQDLKERYAALFVDDDGNSRTSENHLEM